MDLKKLRDGAMQLSEGLVKFNEEGIEKLVTLVDEDPDGIVVRLRALKDVSRNYNNFAGIADGVRCSSSIGRTKFNNSILRIKKHLAIQDRQ